MCGVFGFVAKPGRRVNIKRLRDVAAATETRGRHAFGFAWADPDGHIYVFKQKGRITDHLGLLSMAADATVIVGHCRWATHGDVDNNINNHPHVAWDGAYVHNGVISDHAGIARRHRLRLRSECDSEVIGRLIERGRGSGLLRLKMASRACTEGRPGSLWAGRPSGAGYVVLGIWDEGLGDGPALYGCRSGNPLVATDVRSGHYVASLPRGLGAHWGEVRDDSVFRLTQTAFESCKLGWEVSHV